jgi:hypothetical protein
MLILAPTPLGTSHSPVVTLSGSLIAAAVTLGRRSRTSPLAQLLVCYSMRRYLATLGRVGLELWLRGGVGLFPVVWRYLTGPSEEVYWNPLSQQWVFDVRIGADDIPALLKTPSLEAWAVLAGWRLVNQETWTTEAWAAFKLSLDDWVSPEQWLKRYAFS